MHSACTITLITNGHQIIASGDNMKNTWHVQFITKVFLGLICINACYLQVPLNIIKDYTIDLYCMPNDFKSFL